MKALNAFTTLANEAIAFAEPYLIHHLDVILTAAAHKNAKVRAASEQAVQAFANKMSTNALAAALSKLFQFTEVGVAWQSRVLALKTIASYGDHCPEQLGSSLPDVSYLT